MNELICIIIDFLYVYFLLCTIYISFFSIISYFYKPIKLKESNELRKFAVLIPAYKEDVVINECVDSLINQSYCKWNYDIHVISEGMALETNNSLRDKNVFLYEVNFENSSKANSLMYVSKELKQYDYIVIIDADNMLPYNYLRDINTFVCSTNCIALQTHRRYKSISNNISFMDSVIEEMNNTIYRKGHNAIHLSSSIIGSGIVLDYKWFLDNVLNLNSTGEDKEIEEKLLIQNKYIYYSDNIIFEDEKINNRSNMKYQRRRWLATQLYLLKILFYNLTSVIKKGNINYLFKIYETIILPKSLLVGFIFVISIIITTINPYDSISWWTLFIILLISLFIAIPNELRDKRLIKCIILDTPFFILMMFFNIFKIRNADKKFIHTQHGNKL